VFRLDADGVLFQSQVLLCLGRLVERGDIRSGEPRLREFEQTYYPKVAVHLDEWEERLMTVEGDPQLPLDWRYS
jgi:hypothetical protein